MTNINSTKAALALVTKAVSAYVGSERSAREALVSCAAATFAVTDLGLIGKGMSADGGWDSQRDYAGKFLHPVTGQPVSQSSVIMWRRVGRAMSVGITPDAVNGKGEADTKVRNTFDRIVQVWGDARVTEVLDNGSKTAIVKAVAGLYGKDGKRIKADRPAGKGAGSKDTGATEGNTPEVPPTRSNSTTLAAIETLAARLTAKMSKAENKALAVLIESLTDRLAISENGGVAPVATPQADAA